MENGRHGKDPYVASKERGQRKAKKKKGDLRVVDERPLLIYPPKKDGKVKKKNESLSWDICHVTTKHDYTGNRKCMKTGGPGQCLDLCCE